MDEFAAFYRGSYVSLLRVVATVTTDRADAEDVLQEAYAAAAREWRRVGGLDNPAAWVRRVAINRAIDLHRRVRRRDAAYARVRAPQPVLDEVSLEVQSAVRALPLDERVVVVLHHLLGLTIAEIGQELDRPTGTIKAQLVRGRVRLAGSLRVTLEDVP